MEEEDALGDLMELVKSLSADIEKVKAEHDCCLFEEDEEDFSSLEVDVLGSPTTDDDEYSMIVEALNYAPDTPVVLRFDDYSNEK